MIKINKFFKSTHGFTLIEVLVSVVIIGLILGSIYSILGLGIESWFSGTNETHLLQDAWYGVYRMQRAIQSSNHVDIEVCKSRDSLTVKDDTFRMVGNDLRINTSPLVSHLSSLTFTKFNTSSGTRQRNDDKWDIIKIDLTVKRHGLKHQIITYACPRN